MVEQTRIQTITLTLTDGRKIGAIVPEFWDTITPLGIQSVTISTSFDLPAGCHLDTLESLKDLPETPDESAP